jgi:penicillin-binding protein 2
MASFKNDELQAVRFRLRIWLALGVVLIALGLIAARMYVLQVQRHETLFMQAERNRTAVLPISPPRGRILDRHGVVLADNEPTFTLEITPARAARLADTIESIGQLIELSDRDVRRFQRLVAESRRFDSLPLRNRLSAEEMSIIAAQLYRLPGVEIRARNLRHYPLGEVASHIVGHVGRINQRDQEMMADWPESRRANYRGTDHIGKLGVEQSYEEHLHGTTGFERVETSATGRVVRVLETIPPTPGDSIRLTIDARLQHLIEKLYGDRRGALVAIDPRNGEILAFVSMPTFNPNLFVDGIDQESWRALNESIDRPLLNRALRGTYPPGSTYKPFMALAGLELGLRQPETAMRDPGYWMFGGRRFRNAGERDLGMVDMRRSIVVSSNVYYYALAHEMGIDAMHDFMRPLGFGQRTGIDLIGEARGILPNPAWKRDAFGRPDQQRWFPGDTISVGIGQGYNNFTILQLASAMATLAHEGVQHTPHLGQRAYPVAQAQGQNLYRADGTRLPLNRAHVQAVLSAMEGVTTEGTAMHVFAQAGYRSGGKTGTAQAVAIGQSERYDAARLEEHQRSHSLYLAFAPLEAPSVALAVIVENAGFGSVAAAPIARRVFDYLLLGLYPSEEDILATQQGASSAPIGPQRPAHQVPWPGQP